LNVEEYLMGAGVAAMRAKQSGRPDTGGTPSGPFGWLADVPGWLLRTAVAVVLAIFLGLAIFGLYRALDPLYPQDLWRYFRPAAAIGTGSVLYRDLEGQLFLAPIGDVKSGKRLLDPLAAASGREIIRDALALPGGKAIAYYATVKRGSEAEQDRVKVIDLQGKITHDISLEGADGELIRPALYVSTSGRYLGVTNRDRNSFYFVDLQASNAFVQGDAGSPPERMQWARNADLRSGYVAGQPSYAASSDGTLRAQVRAGKRRAPECTEGRCETGQELVVTSGTPAGAGKDATVLYGVFASFSAEGWGPIPSQAAQRLYGRLIWSPDGKQLLFSTLDGAVTSSYAISTDGRSQPRLLLEQGEALDWLP
jgi:hypothetical protein